MAAAVMISAIVHQIYFMLEWVFGFMFVFIEANGCVGSYDHVRNWEYLCQYKMAYEISPYNI